MDYIWILFAFICGLSAKLINLPPSIGYLFAGFLLHFLGFQADQSIYTLSDLGITLMLFTIGLKLNVRDLMQKPIWLGTISHTFIWMIVVLFVIKILTFIALSSFTVLSVNETLLLIFAMSFSSTVCVIKLMEDHGEMRTRHGKLAVGILVMQDIIAVIFLVAATGKVPSQYALLLLIIPIIRPVAFKIIDRVGHGELLPLTGFFLALGAYEIFSLLNIKGDLGALLVGMFLASHTKASEINKALMSFKDLFLIGFFLSIGFTALPTWEMFAIAAILTLLLPIKFFMFFILLAKLKVRGRTAFLTALALCNFSEFGLIVAKLSTDQGWLNEQWLIILSLAVALSFISTNIIYNFSHRIFAKHKGFIKQFESSKRLADDAFIQPELSPILVIGMGRVGMGAYKALENNVPGKAWGLDADKGKINWLNEQNYRTYFGDAEDADFWENIDLNKIELVLLALPSVQDIKNITEQLRAANYQGKIAAIARFDDERATIETFGVDKVFNFFNEAGVGFAEESIELINAQSTAIHKI